MSINAAKFDYMDKLNAELYKLDLDFEEKKKIKKREIIHAYIEGFKNFDSESINGGNELNPTNELSNG